MEEIAEKQGFFSRLFGIDTVEEEEFDEDAALDASPTLRLDRPHGYQVSIRRQVHAFSDAVAAADGLKRGEQQIVNLSMASPDLREKIKDFLCGVNYNAEGTWEELGDNIFLLAPPGTYVEVAPASARLSAKHN